MADNGERWAMTVTAKVAAKRVVSTFAPTVFAESKRRVRFHSARGACATKSVSCKKRTTEFTCDLRASRIPRVSQIHTRLLCGIPRCRSDWAERYAHRC